MIKHTIATLALTLLSTPITADTWYDIDGGSYVIIDDDKLSIHDLSSFYYFDEVFSDARTGAAVRLCIGADEGPGIGTDCLGWFQPQANFSNHGKNRSLHFDISRMPLVFEMFEQLLNRGLSMKMSIDNGDLFYASTLNKEYELNREAINILNLND